MMENAHRSVAAIAGQMSLALVRGTARRSVLLRWARELREIARRLEEHAGTSP